MACRYAQDASTVNTESRHVREPLLDVVKAVAICLVVLGHSEVVRVDHPEWYRAIYLVHMPMFLIATGMVTPARLDMVKLRHRVRSLMQPFLVAWVLFLPLAWYRTRDAIEIIGGALWMNGYGLYNQPMWYLGVLSCSLALLWLWDRWEASSGVKCVTVAGSLVIGIWLIPEGRRAEPLIGAVSASRVGMPWGIDLALLTVPLLLLGRSLRHASFALAHNVSRAWIALGLGIALFCVAFVQGCFLDMNARLLSQPGWCVLAVLAGCLACWGLAGVTCAHLPHSFVVAVSSLGRSTLFILLFHAPLQNAVARVLSTLGIWGSSTAAIAVSVIIVMLLTWLDSRWVARMPLLRYAFRPQSNLRR